MNSQVLDTIKEALNDLTQLTPEKIQNLIQETMITFQGIQNKVTSKNEGDREEGLQMVVELKAAMEEQVQKLQKKLNMSPEQIEEYISNPANFSKDEFKAMDESKRELDLFKSQIQEEAKPPVRKKRKEKNLLVC